MEQNNSKKYNIIEYIIDNPSLTLEQVSNSFEISLSSIKKYISSLKNSGDEKDILLYSKYQLRAEKNMNLGRSKGGSIGKIQKPIDKDEIRLLAIDIIANNLTVEEAAKKVSKPKSTFYENLIKGLSSKDEGSNIYNKLDGIVLNDKILLNDLKALFVFHKTFTNFGKITSVETVDLKDIIDKSVFTVNRQYYISAAISMKELIKKYKLIMEQIINFNKKNDGNHI